MKKIILKKNGCDLLGSDSLMYVDGRFKLSNVIKEVEKRNKRYSKNFPHKVADSFYFAGERLQRTSPDIAI
jgi:hypothetical protein